MLQATPARARRPSLACLVSCSMPSGHVPRTPSSNSRHSRQCRWERTSLVSSFTKCCIPRTPFLPHHRLRRRQRTSSRKRLQRRWPHSRRRAYRRLRSIGGKRTVGLAVSCLLMRCVSPALSTFPTPTTLVNLLPSWHALSATACPCCLPAGTYA